MSPLKKLLGKKKCPPSRSKKVSPVTTDENVLVNSFNFYCLSFPYFTIIVDLGFYYYLGHFVVFSSQGT